MLLNNGSILFAVAATTDIKHLAASSSFFKGEIFVQIPVWPHKQHILDGFVVWALLWVVFEQCVGTLPCGYTFRLANERNTE